jgi:ribosomal protein S18 acetylase RimI-like enzyme
VDSQELFRAARSFERTWAETGAEAQRTDFGFLLRHLGYPRIHMANLAWVERLPSGGIEEVLASLDAAFEGTAVRHRNVVFDDAQVAFENQEAFVARGFHPAAELAMARVGLPACITNPDLALREVGADATEDDFRRLRMRLFEGMGYALDESRQLYTIARERGAVLGQHDFVGYFQGHPAGTISLWPRGLFALIGDVATMPEFRNRGVARTMLFEVSKKSINAGCEYSVLFTDLVDSPQAMYKSLGYQPVGELRSFLRVPGLASF